MDAEVFLQKIKQLIFDYVTSGKVDLTKLDEWKKIIAQIESLIKTTAKE